MKKHIVFLTFIFIYITTIAGEGMWIPSQIQRNIEQMQQNGLLLNADDLYSDQGPSLKDAIVRFGRGCTGSFISDKGLVITNHHCGYSYIQRHSSVEKDYLTHGFWAANMQEELVNDGLTVSVLVKMEDVTERVLSAVEKNLSEEKYQEAVAGVSKDIVNEAAMNGQYEAEVKPFYSGNQYYLFVYQVYKDVRMVGTPPSAIGKFGGDTDNWVWPRHTGDFMFFRVYADANNQPAPYSPDNQPYRPAQHLKVSATAPAPDDFTMVYGFPGRTSRYITSDAVDFVISKEDPLGIDMRTIVLDIYEQHMNADDKVRIQYASKHAGLSNAWKKWMGEIRGLKNFDVVNEKINQENAFSQWASTADGANNNGYSGLTNAFRQTYSQFNPYRYAFRLFQEAGRTPEVVRFALQFENLVKLSSQQDADFEKVRAEVEKLKTAARQHFRNYHQPIDQKVLAELTLQYMQLSDPAMMPPALMSVKSKYGNNTEKFAADIFKKSFLVSEEATMHFLENFHSRDLKKLVKDPAYSFASGINDYINTEIQVPMQQLQYSLDSLYRKYIAAMMVMYPDSNFFPDANSTLRIAYGKVEGSYPLDGIFYLPFTTAEGILAKNEITSVSDYWLPEKLYQQLSERDYGQYATNDTLKVNYIASNHTTGGNSGSPVLGANGEFIGINFDRTWESTMSDIRFDPEQCRNIVVSTPYILWVIDKYAGMGYLIEEMDIVRGNTSNGQIIN